MKKTINVFVSQPMHGIATQAVMDKRQAALDDFRKLGIELKWFTEEDEIVDVNPCWSKPAESASRLWYLGRSIQTMADADYVIFVRGWSKARGCKAEFQACEEYFKYHLHPRDMSDIAIWKDGDPTIKGNLSHIWFGKDDT